MTASLEQQIHEIERTLHERSHDYGWKVSQGLMTAAESRFRLGRLDAVLRTLRWLQAREDMIMGVMGTAIGEEREAGRSPALAVHEGEE